VRIVIVDAGNYSRSPAAQVMLRAALEQAGLAGRIEVGSAGLKDKHAGDPPDPRTVERVEARGLSLAGFRCRQITDDDFQADVLLAMDGDTLTALRERAPKAAAARLGLYLHSAGGDDIADPFYGGDEGFDQAIAQIAEGSQAIAAALAEHRPITAD
jgi:protein-tyrosine phosphatase